jgi:hypothetical protein
MDIANYQGTGLEARRFTARRSVSARRICAHCYVPQVCDRSAPRRDLHACTDSVRFVLDVVATAALTDRRGFVKCGDQVGRHDRR